MNRRTALAIASLAFPASWALASMKISGTWTMTALDGNAVAGERRPYFKIADGQVDGFDGCNMFGGPLHPAGQISSTRMACPDNVAKLPIDLQAFAARLKHARIDGKVLHLPAEGGWAAATFEATAP